jgi:hypothetical protein
MNDLFLHSSSTSWSSRREFWTDLLGYHCGVAVPAGSEMQIRTDGVKF